MNITALKIKKLAAPSTGQAFYRDDEIRGFAVRVTANGERAFVWEGRIRGRVRRITIANCADIPLQLARKYAHDIRAAVARGEDPAAKFLAARSEGNFGDLAAQFIELYAKPHRQQWQRDEKRLNTHFGRWYTRRVSDIKHEDVSRAQIVVAREHGKVSSNRAMSLFRRVFTWAAEAHIYEGPNPAEHLKFFKEQARERFLLPDELQRVNEALTAEPDWRFRAFFALDLTIGVRKGNLLSARWDAVDLGNGTLRLPHTKNGQAMTVPLPAPAVRLLEQLPSRGQSEWVFPTGRPGARSRSKSGHLSDPSRAWERIRRRAGVADVTIHDLRRTVGAMLAAAGMSSFVIGQALGHKSAKATAIYARLHLDPVRAALETTSSMVAIPDMMQPATVEDPIDA
jgi:integrase